MKFFCRALLTLLFCLPLTALPASADDDKEAAEAFVTRLGERAIEMVTDETLLGEDRRMAFRDLLDDNFDMSWIGQFVLGRHWRRASAEQRRIYLELFRESIVFTYTNQFDDYSGQTFEVTGSTETGRYRVVKSRIVSPVENSAQVIVDWRLLKEGDTFRIVDVVIEGISMGITQRNEYSSVIESNSGRIDSLLDKMEEILNRLRKRA